MFETILKTTDGGQNWIVIRNGPYGEGTSHYSVFFVNPNTGWIGGSGQYVLKTTDGGLNFSQTPVPTDAYDLYFKNASTGIQISSGISTYKTTNGGISWYYVPMPIGYIIPMFNSISVVNNQYCYLSGNDGRVFKSANFGETWDSVTRIPFETHWTYSSCGFANQFTGWVGGDNGYNMLFKTTNGGINWLQENTGTISFPWYSIYCYNDSIVWGVGKQYIIMNTTNGGETLVQISINKEQIPKEYELYQNYPNPFNPTTNIRFDIPKDILVSIKIYDILGREVKTLVNEFKNAGSYLVSFDGSEFASGVYFYRIQAGSFVNVKRMILIK